MKTIVTSGRPRARVIDFSAAKHDDGCVQLLQSGRRRATTTTSNSGPRRLRPVPVERCWCLDRTSLSIHHARHERFRTAIAVCCVVEQYICRSRYLTSHAKFYSNVGGCRFNLGRIYQGTGNRIG